MPIQKLTKAELEARPVSVTGAHPEYVAFLESIRVGQGGKATTKSEGVAKQSIKNRLNRAAEQVGLEIKYLRSPKDEVVFQVAKRL